MLKNRASVFLLRFFTLFFLPVTVFAQFAGISIPQTTQSTPFSSVSCTGSTQVATVGNFAQTEHFITITTSGVLGFRATVQGSHDGVTFNDISDVATVNASTVMGQGYYPVMQVSVTCATAAGTFTVKYSGEATAPAPQIGALQSAQLDKTLAVGVSAGSNFTSQTLRAPFGNTAGALYFTYSGAGPANSLLSVGCTTLAIATPTTVANYPLVTSTAVQFFPVPALPCDFITMTYTAGGASVQTFTLSFVFNQVPVTGGDPCQGATVPKSSTPISLTASGRLVTGLTGHRVFACDYNFTIAGSTTATAQFVSGTGSTCGTGTVNLTGTFAGNAATASSTPTAINMAGANSIFTSAAAQDVCLLLAGATPSVQGVFSFIQQ